MTEVNGEKVVLQTFRDDILEQLRLQYEHGNRVPLVVSKSTVTLSRLLSLLHSYWMVTRMGYSVIEQARDVVLSFSV
jgi:hypothetical protein